MPRCGILRSVSLGGALYDGRPLTPHDSRRTTRSRWPRRQPKGPAIAATSTLALEERTEVRPQRQPPCRAATRDLPARAPGHEAHRCDSSGRCHRPGSCRDSCLGGRAPHPRRLVHLRAKRQRADADAGESGRADGSDRTLLLRTPAPRTRVRELCDASTEGECG